MVVIYMSECDGISNLIDNSKKHIKFLQNLHLLGVTLKAPSIES